MPGGEVSGRKPRVSADLVGPPEGGRERDDDDFEPSPHREPKLVARKRRSPIRGPPKKRKPGAWRTPPVQVGPGAYFIDEFCAAYRLSPSMYFKLRTEGKGPTEMQVGRRRMISFEAAEQWRREREAASTVA